MSKEFSNILVKIELVSGGLLFFLAAGLYLDSLKEPSGMVYFEIIELWIFSVIVLLCGFLLKKSKAFKISSQLVFSFATLFIYIDLCTAYSRWYLI